MHKIYGGNDGEPEGQPMSESMGNDIEAKFINEMCNMIINTLDINYNDRRIFWALFKGVFNDKLDNRGKNNPGLLQQYEAYVLDKSSERIIGFLELGDVKVNHSHATHAKFADIIKAIEDKFAEPVIEEPNVVDYRDETKNCKCSGDGWTEHSPGQIRTCTCKRKEEPTSIPDLIKTYKGRINEINELIEDGGMNEHLIYETERATLEAVVNNLSSWLVYHY